MIEIKKTGDITAAIASRIYETNTQQVPRSNPKEQEKVEESPQQLLDNALGVLGLVSFGSPQSSTILDVSSFQAKEDPQTIVNLAYQIKQCRKNGWPISFENGRIFMSKEVFDQILELVNDPGKSAEQKVSVLVSPKTETGITEGLSIQKAQEMLSNISSPLGKKYIIAAQGKKKEIEKALLNFWNDYGGGGIMAIKSPGLSYAIQPSMIIGENLNPLVAAKIQEVFVKQKPPN